MKYGWTFRNAPSLSFCLFCLSVQQDGYTALHEATLLLPKSFWTSWFIWTVHTVRQSSSTLLVTVNRKGTFWSHTRAQVTQVKGKGRGGILVIPVSDKGLELYHSFSKKKKKKSMALPSRLWKKAENLKMRERGKLIINITTSTEEILLFVTPSQFTWLCYISLVCPFMYTCNFPSGK